jgi:hypothetical protein
LAVADVARPVLAVADVAYRHRVLADRQMAKRLRRRENVSTP